MTIANDMTDEEKVQQQMIESISVYIEAKQNLKEKEEDKIVFRDDNGDLMIENNPIKILLDQTEEDSSVEYSEEDSEILKMADEYNKTHMKKEEYVVRGALLECDQGSHERRMHLPETRGIELVIVGDKDDTAVQYEDLMCTSDYLAETEGSNLNDVHIPHFGICKCEGNTNDNVSYAKRAKVVINKESNKFEEDPAFKDGVQRGQKCLPVIVGTWENSCLDLKMGSDDVSAITTNSFLVCTYGGIIRIVRSGQEDGKRELNIEE